MPTTEKNEIEGDPMTADELKRMLEREAEMMSDDERRRFIDDLCRLARTPPPRRLWLETKFGPVVVASDVLLWLN